LARYNYCSSIQPVLKTEDRTKQPVDFQRRFFMDTQVKGTSISVRQQRKGQGPAGRMAQIEKQFGKGTIMRLGEGEVIEDIQVVSTGSLGLDIALGVGGLPRGRVIEIYGPESSGKTTLTLQVIAEMQKQGGHLRLCRCRACAGRAVRPEARRELSDLLISQPDTGEQALEIVDSLVRSGAVDLIVIDSVAALTPRPKSKAKWATACPACRPA
jgi:recombination protein RecA